MPRRGVDPRLIIYAEDKTREMINRLRLERVNLSLFVRDAIELHYNYLIKDDEAMDFYRKGEPSNIIR